MNFWEIDLQNKFLCLFNNWLPKEKKVPNVKGYETLKSYLTKEILPLILEDSDWTKKIRVGLNGFNVRINSLRLQSFKKSLTCVICGIKGSIFLLQRGTGIKAEKDNPHLNLYGINEIGELILMTKDHIVSKSKGGKNHTDNIQIMCTICNCKKGDNYED